jgi:hypothetical protein
VRVLWLAFLVEQSQNLRRDPKLSVVNVLQPTAIGTLDQMAALSIEAVSFRTRSIGIEVRVSCIFQKGDKTPRTHVALFCRKKCHQFQEFR